MSPTARSGSTTKSPKRSAAGAWLAEAAASARLVSDQPQLWVAGGVSWAATAGPVALLVAVVPPPGIADLTFLGSRAVSSSLWPWNVVALAVGVVLLALLAIALVALAEAALRTDAGAMAAPTIVRAAGVTLASTLPVIALTGAVALAAIGTARLEFVAPGDPGAVELRTLAAVAPLLLLLSLAIVAAGAYAAAARLAVIDHSVGVRGALGGSPRMLARGGAAAAIHVGVTTVARLAYLVLATLLLAVLWAPIGVELASGADLDAPLILLLVGFVAIWLCLVLGGGALHAWGSLTWIRVLALPAPRQAGAVADAKETQSIL